MNPTIKQLLNNPDESNKILGIYLALNEGYQEEEIFDELFDDYRFHIHNFLVTHESYYNLRDVKVIFKHSGKLIIPVKGDRVEFIRINNIEFINPNNLPIEEQYEVAINAKKCFINLLVDKLFVPKHFKIK
jgi:hypothetical protein